jgi:hypothetical protein
MRLSGGLPVIVELLTSNIPAIQEEVVRLITNLSAFRMFVCCTVACAISVLMRRRWAMRPTCSAE